MEVWHEGEWGTVCDDGLIEQYKDGSAEAPYKNGNAVANVVCRELGFETGHPIATTNMTGARGTGTIWLDDVTCNGYEASLLDCEKRWSYDNNACFHYEDFSVLCSH